jgi:cytoskeletal protein RodZ
MNIETAGARLKKIRQEKGLSLEDIQKKTKIHLNVLRAIEGDSISNLSPIYLKGFIKIYCGSLGLDPKEYIGSSSQPPVKPVLNATVGRPLGGRIENKPSFIKDASMKLNSMNLSVNLKKIAVLAVVALIFIFLGVNLIKFIFSRKKSPLERAKVLMVTSVPKSATVQNKVSKDLVQGLTVGIFDGVLTRGRSETWHAKEKIELSLGDAGAVELQVNDQRFPNLGRRGKPLKNILINKEGLKISR